MLRHILDNYSNATCTRAIHATSDGLNADRIARIARIRVATPQKTGISASDEVVSNWWLIHFADLEPVQVAIWPPSTHAEVLALNPQAIAAGPIPSPIDESSEVMTNE